MIWLAIGMAVLCSCQSGENSQVEAVSGSSWSNPVSADLQELLDWQNEVLLDEGSKNLKAPVFEEYLALLLKNNNLKYDPDAAESFFDRWEKDLTNPLWLKFAQTQRPVLPQKTRIDSLFQVAAGPDSSSLVANYIYGIRNIDSDQTGAQAALARCVSSSENFGNSYSFWAGLKLASYEAAQDSQSTAVERMTPVIIKAWELGGGLLASECWLQLSGMLKGSQLHNESLEAAIMAADCAKAAGHVFQSLRAEYEVGLGQREMQQPRRALQAFLGVSDTAMAQDFYELAFYSAYEGARDARSLGELAAEQRLHHRAIQVGEALPDTIMIYRFMAVLANDHRRSGHPDSARYWLEKAKILRDLSSVPDYDGFVAQNEARLLVQMGRYTEAESLRVNLGMDLSDPRFRRSEVSLMISLIRQGLEIGDPVLCYRSLERAMSLDPESLEATPNYDPYLQLSMVSAEFYAQQGELHLAYEQLANADTRVPEITRESLWYLTRIQGIVGAASGDQVMVLQSFEKCLEIAEELQDPDLVNRSRVQLGATLLDMGRADEAEGLFADSQEAPEYWTQLTSRLWTGLARSRNDNHHGALQAFEEVESLLDADAPADIVQRLNLELGRSHEAVGNNEKALRAFEHAKSVSQIQVQDSDILGRLNDGIQREIAEALLALRYDHPEFRSKPEGGHEERNLAAWGRTGGQNQVAPEHFQMVPRLEFFLGPERAFVWVCEGPGKASRWFELPAVGPLSRWVQAARVDLGYPDREVDQNLLHRLGEALLQPASEVWDSGEILEILPDGVLDQLSWCALPWGDDVESQALDHGPMVFLMESVTKKSSSPSPEIAPAESRLLVLGSNEGIAGSKEGELHHAEREAKQVASLWAPQLVDLRIGDESRWEELASGEVNNFDLIHIASHAQVSEGDAGQSAIRIAGVSLGRPLTIREISSLPVAADLVFLSSCEGGRVHQSSGNGLKSFAGAFLEAGAGAVIASSLVIEDETASRLATAFYRHWLGGMKRAAALRAAQIEVRDSDSGKSHPFYWSGYRLFHPGN